MGNNYWKQRERVIARMFGTQRNPGSGSNLGTSRSDSRHERLYIELKCRKTLPGWLKELINDTNIKAYKEGKIPIVILHEKNKKDDFIMCQVSDLVAISRELKE